MLNELTQLEVLQQIWARSAGEYVFTPTIDRGVFTEGLAAFPENVSLLPQSEGVDVYFTPVLYDFPDRKTENISQPGVLYADLDDGYSRRQLDEYPPSVLWETSPFRLQAVWFLTDPMYPEDQIELNRRFNYNMRADANSWIPTKLLRIPGSANFKRGGVHGRLLKLREALEYDPDDLSAALPELPNRQGLGATVPAVPSPEDWQALLDEVWPVLPLSLRSMMKKSAVSDRSLHLTQMAAAMATISLPPETIFGLLSRLRTNKFADRPEVLWSSVVEPIVASKRTPV